MKILITGATGLIGREVGKELVRLGHEIIIVSRSKERALKELPFPHETIEGDLARSPIEDARLKEVEGVIHLMGESIAEGRWNREKKTRIVESRTLGTKNLRQSLSQAGAKPSVLLSASAIGFYGDGGEQELSEESPAGKGFLADLCTVWEKEALLAKKEFPKTRVAILRFGIVLSPFGGALEKMLTPYRMGIGGALSKGQQWMSWIHIHDLVRMICAAIEKPYEGIYNAVSPTPVRNRDFSAALAGAFGKHLGPSIPAFALRLAVGELADELLRSQRVLPKRAEEEGFQFEHPQLKQVLAEVAGFFEAGEMLLRSEQYLPYQPNEVFPFFADARNLERITPKTMNFHITGMSSKEIQEGTLIDYKLRIRGVPVHWQTRIEEWKPGSKFVDTQLKGPYEKWHHTHTFEKLGKGTLMTDLVRYKVPLQWLGRLVAGALVTHEVGTIFKYRRDVCAKENFLEPVKPVVLNSMV